ncbi:SRR1-like protein [Latimeria chalumnae]|uniref:SRR1 domain containing n=1 Tax=Latimeria chalumnae TaxID=7897 RepID=H3AME2_LATCH|nr:PREDICTED: SRR1-like protein [Latimeria chalumnae]XP_006007270.1 PREDICTED: SRR1-like protein [Latimeria chalumnae]|eukprot:XP_006007269.1 PREDICTED: SRR1-like protein [Latimeria chalumnae]
MAGTDGAWQVVRKKKRGKVQRRGNLVKKTEEFASGDDDVLNYAQYSQKIKQRLTEAMRELTSSEFLDPLLKIVQNCFVKCFPNKEEMPKTSEKVHSTHQIRTENTRQKCVHLEHQATIFNSGFDTVTLDCVCYGIGNFSSCPAPKYQLALLLLLLEKLKIPKERCYVFDPLFSKSEITFLKDLGLTVILENEEGKRKIHKLTIFYMVHCGNALYNNLLWRNWSVEELSKIFIIGNSFRGIEERLVTRILQENYKYIFEILKVTEESPLPYSLEYEDIFNDTSIHWFPSQKLYEIPSRSWESPAEPIYRESEETGIIRNQKK